MKTTKFLMHMLAAVSALAWSAGAQSFLTNDLTAYYPFNGNANDASGNGNNGTVNGAVLTTNQLGLANSAYSFNGSSWIQLPDSVMPAEASQFTVSAWVLADQGPYTGAATIFHTTPRNGEFGLGVQASSTNIWGFGVKLQDGNFYSIVAPMITNEWVQAVTVFVQGQYEELWMNGSLAQSNALPNLALFTSTFSVNSAIGIYDFTGGPYDAFSGAIGDVRFYDTALTPAEIQQLYQIEGPSQPCEKDATATASVASGFVVGTTLTSGGCGYTNTPVVLVQGGGGTGATATATVSNGEVTGITITDAGTGYTNAPQIYIYSPLGLQITVQKLVAPYFMDLLLGTNYQLQVSADMKTWINSGSPFAATNSVMNYPEYWNTDGGSPMYFRLQVAP